MAVDGIYQVVVPTFPLGVDVDVLLFNVMLVPSHTVQDGSQVIWALIVARGSGVVGPLEEVIVNDPVAVFVCPALSVTVKREV